MSRFVSYSCIVFLMICGILSVDSFSIANDSYLKSNQIILTQQRFMDPDQCELVSKEFNSSDSLETYLKISLKKLNTDVEHLTSIMFYLRMLSEYKIVKRISDFKQKEMDNFNLTLELIKAKRDLLAVRIYNNRNNNDKKVQLEILNDLTLVLCSNRSESINYLWNSLSKYLESPYKSWNKEFQRLNKKLNANKKPYQIISDNLRFDEAGFVDSFFRLQSLLRGLSEPNSAYF